MAETQFRLVYLWVDESTFRRVSTDEANDADAEVCAVCADRMLPDVGQTVCTHRLCPCCARGDIGCKHPEHWNED